MTITRYDYCDYGANTGMRDSKDGEFVDYEDHLAAIAEKDAENTQLRAALEACRIIDALALLTQEGR